MVHVLICQTSIRVQLSIWAAVRQEIHRVSSVVLHPVQQPIKIQSTQRPVVQLVRAKVVLRKRWQERNHQEVHHLPVQRNRRHQKHIQNHQRHHQVHHPNHRQYGKFASKLSRSQIPTN